MSKLQIKIFIGQPDGVEKEVNDFLKTLAHTEVSVMANLQATPIGLPKQGAIAKPGQQDIDIVNTVLMSVTVCWT